jgi:multidrug efflux pump subunit AcrB
VEFESGYDIDEALQKVRDKVNKAEPELPPDVEKPEIIEINFSEFPIVVANIAGPYSLVKLKDIAEDLKDEIEKVDGVLDVKSRGGLAREVKIDVDINKLNHYNVRFKDIINAVADENKTIPGGSIDVNNSSFLVRVPGEFDKPYLIEDIIVKLKDGAPVYLKNIAEVYYGFKERKTYARLNSKNAVSISISKSVGKNIIDIADKVKEILDKKRAVLPSDVEIYISTDQSKDIKEMVRELENNIFSGLVLVVLILFVALGVRNALFVAAAIPLSMLISFLILQALGVTLNFGHGLLEAAKLGTAEVAWPVTTSTFTTVAGFSPLLFWPGIVGEFMLYIPLVLIVTLLSSLFVAMIINPVFASKFMRLEHHTDGKKSLFQKIMLPINKITHLFVDVYLPKTLDVYKKILTAALGPVRAPDQKVHKRNWFGFGAIFLFFIVTGIISSVLPAGLSIFINLILGVGILILFTNSKLKVLWGTFLMLFFISQIYFLFGHGIEFFPETQPKRIYVSLESPSGTNIEMSDEIVKSIEEKIERLQNKDIKDVLVVVGSSNNPFDAGSSTPNKSSVTIQFIDFEERGKSSSESTDEIREALLKTAGTDVLVQKQDMGPPVGSAVNIEISGDDYKILGELSMLVKEAIRTVPGLVDLKDDFDDGKPELRVEIDREKAALYGLNTRLIANSIRTAINGFTASKYRVDEDEYDITVRLRKDQRSSINSLETLEVIYNNKKGKTLSVPLISVAKIHKSKGPGAIRRKDLSRVITISGNAAEGFNENEVLNKVKKQLEDFSIPSGYSIDFTGQQEFQKESEDFLSKAFLIALLMIFLILVIQFNSLSQPLIIMSAVVISLVGVFIGLILYAMPFGIIMTGIGIISLAGVVVNNNIVLIDYINVLRKRGFSRREALIRAGLRRFRPVTLTAITTILGLIPLTFGFGFDIYSFSFAGSGESAEFWRSMGISVIFGLAFATVLTLLIVPTIYSTLDDVANVLTMWKKNIFSK